MASWKKVLVSGSSIEVAAITSSATPTISSIGSNYVTMIDPTTGYISKITSGNFQASLGQYAYTASADTGTPVIIGAADTLDVAGGTGVSTAVASVAGGADITVNLDYTGTDNFIDAATDLEGTAIVTGDTIIYHDATDNNVKKGLVSDLPFSNNSGTVTSVAITGTDGIDVDSGSPITTSGTITLGLSNVPNASLANSSITVNGTAIALGGSDTITANTTNALTVDDSTLGLNIGTTFNGSAARTISVKSGGITETELNSSVAGTGLSGGGGSALAVTYGSTTGTAAEGDTSVTFSGTTNEIELSTNTFTTVGGGGSVTIGLPDDVTVGNNLTVTVGLKVGPATASPTAGQIVTDQSITIEAGGLQVLGGDSVFAEDVTINGDLTVNGTTTTINTDNLLVEDKFALFASGSATATDGGIIVQSATGAGTAVGYAFGYENSVDRWAYQDSLAYNATAFGTPTAYAVTAEYAASTPPANPAYGGASGFGNIFVNTSTQEIFIYS